MEVPSKEFTSILKKSMVITLRRTLQDNPFGSYAKWVESKRKNKPLVITLNNAKSNPEVLVDFLGNRYVLLSASITKEGVVLPMGVLEHLFFNKSMKYTKEYILTPEIARILKKDRFYPRKALNHFPFTDQTLQSLRKKLGYDTYSDRNTWLALHINEILTSTANSFCLKHKEMGIKKHVIFDIKLSVKNILNDLNNSPDSYLMEILLNYWKTPNDITRKAVDNFLEKYKSKKYRRIFSILKEADML